MLDFLHRYRLTVIITVFLLAGFSLTVIERGTYAGHHGPIASIGAQLTGVTQSGVASLLDGVGNMWDRHMHLVGVQEENESLRAELHRLREERIRLLGVMQENARLREMVDFQQSHGDLALVPARVIARDINPYFRVTRIRIDAESHRIQKHMPVVSSAGLVGEVSEVDGRFAEVLLTVDPRSSIDVVVQRNRARGLLRGLGHENDYQGELSYLLRREEVAEGDVVVTSGMGGRFPQHLLVGRIESIQTQSYGLFQQVRVAPAVDFTRLEEVFVVTGRGTE